MPTNIAVPQRVECEHRAALSRPFGGPKTGGSGGQPLRCYRSIPVPLHSQIAEQLEHEADRRHLPSFAPEATYVDKRAGVEQSTVSSCSYITSD